MTINDLFLACSQLNEKSYFALYNNFKDYASHKKAFRFTRFEDLESEICELKVAHFQIDVDFGIAYVEVEK